MVCVRDLPPFHGSIFDGMVPHAHAWGYMLPSLTIISQSPREAMVVAPCVSAGQYDAKRVDSKWYIFDRNMAFLKKTISGWEMKTEINKHCKGNMMDWNNNWYLKWGLTLVLFLIGSFFMLKSYGYCNEYPIPCSQEYLFKDYESRSPWGKGPPVWQPGSPSQSQAPQKNDRKMWQEAYDDHHFHAVRTYTDAYNKVWFLPDISFRQLGRDAWIAACATAGGSTVTGRLVSAFATMLCSYGLHCLDEWDYIQEKLYWADYHFKQCEHYARLLHGG